MRTDPHEVGLRRVSWRVWRLYRSRPLLLLAPWLWSTVAAGALTGLVWATGGVPTGMISGGAMLPDDRAEALRQLLLVASWIVPLAFAPYLTHAVVADRVWDTDRFRALRALPLLRASVTDMPRALLAAVSLGASILVGLLMLIVPGYIALMWGAYMVTAAVVERPKPAWNSWGVSRDLAGVGGVEAAGMLTGLICVNLVADALVTRLLEEVMGALSAGVIVNPLLATFNLVVLSVLYLRLRELAAARVR